MSTLRESRSRGASRARHRILFMTDAFLPHAGGARVYYYELIRHLAEYHDSDITVLTRKVPGYKDFDRGQTARFRILRFGHPLQSWKWQELAKGALPFASACGLLATQPFDLIHFGDLCPPGILSVWLKRVFRKPYIGYCHGEEITLTDRFRYAPKLRDVIYRNSDMIVAANEFARSNLLRVGVPNEQIRKITPGVDAVRFQPRAPGRGLLEQFGLQGKRVVLSVSRLVPRKGHKTVLQALRILLTEIPDVVFVIAGTGPEEDALRKAAGDMSVTEAVRFAGYVADADLPEFYNAAEVFVLPNRDDGGDVEGFGMVFLEANACGKPVIGGRSGGTSEAILHGQTGFLVRPEDPVELAARLRLLLTNNTLGARLGQQGLVRVRSEFSWKSSARLLAAVNDEVIACARTRAMS